MQLFLFLNDLAGRYPFLDAAMRAFTIGAVPLVATLWLAHLLLFPRPVDVSSRRQAALAVIFALLCVAFLGLAMQLFAQSLHLGTISPRPFMTRRVDLLFVEPQDNSFPCFEVALASVFAVGLAFLSRKWGIVGGALTVLFGVGRLFCGVNYFADVAVGALLGVGLTALTGAVFGAQLRVFQRQPRWQLLCSVALLLLTAGGTYFSLAATPRFAAKLPVFWGSTATAATPETAAPETATPEAAAEAILKTTRAARGAIQEGEGVVEDAAPQSAEELAFSKRSHLFLPAAEAHLKAVLGPVARPFRLIDVEVAPVKAGDKPYRCAALRFEIPLGAPQLRRRTAFAAMRLVKVAFRADPELENVDVTAIVRGDATQIDGSAMRFAGDEVPVFTASIQRKNLTLPAPRWANDPKLDAGSWLRTRSRLFINERILPAAPGSRDEPVAAPFDAVPLDATPTAIPLEDGFVAPQRK